MLLFDTSYIHIVNNIYATFTCIYAGMQSEIEQLQRNAKEKTKEIKQVTNQTQEKSLQITRNLEKQQGKSAKYFENQRNL